MGFQDKSGIPVILDGEKTRMTRSTTVFGFQKKTLDLCPVQSLQADTFSNQEQNEQLNDEQVLLAAQSRYSQQAN